MWRWFIWCVRSWRLELPGEKLAWITFDKYYDFSDNGIVMTCGDGSFGVLGHGDWNSSSKPKLIEQLLRWDFNQ